MERIGITTTYHKYGPFFHFISHVPGKRTPIAARINVRKLFLNILYSNILYYPVKSYMVRKVFCLNICLTFSEQLTYFALSMIDLKSIFKTCLLFVCT